MSEVSLNTGIDPTLTESTQEAARRILDEDPGLELRKNRGLDFETKRLFDKAGGEQLQ